MITLPRKISTWLQGEDFGRQVFQFASDVFDALKALRTEQKAQDDAIAALEVAAPPEAHASTHLPGGADALATGTTSTTFCVGNDARLSDDRTASGLRTATTVVSISASAAPTAGQALIASSSTLAAWGAVSGGGGGTEPALLAKPASAHAEDDEFDSTSLDAAWQLYDETADALIAFGGAITDQYTVNSTTGMKTDVATTWPSWLMLQPRNNLQFYWVARNYALTVNQWVCVRATAGFRINQVDSEVEFSLTLAGDNAGKPDKDNYITLRAIPVGANHQWQLFKREAGVNTTVQTTGTISNGGVPGFDFLIFQKVNTTYHAWLASYGGSTVYVGTTTHAATMAWSGLRIRQDAVSPSAQMLVHVDSFRFRDTIVPF